MVVGINDIFVLFGDNCDGGIEWSDASDIDLIGEGNIVVVGEGDFEGCGCIFAGYSRGRDARVGRLYNCSRLEIRGGFVRNIGAIKNDTTKQYSEENGEQDFFTHIR